MNSKYLGRKSGAGPAIKELVLEYKKRKSEIKKRLKEFSSLHKGKDEDIFQELGFCLLTANANALQCDKAIKELRKMGLLFKGNVRRIMPVLKGKARFHNKKASYMVGARNFFTRAGRLEIKSRLNADNIIETRDWLVDNIKGFGYKEASHFLRNIGLGKNIAILDRHILRNLKRYGVIKTIPSSLGSRCVYFDIEEKMKAFSKKTGIPLEDMDLLFWSLQTGFVFK